jgi:Asp-tRNA(Asn)/Glu-tRNA(Gln) amidotransferase A subunit family amidase
MRLAAAALLLCPTLAYAQAFHVEESSIESSQRAIQRGETTCREVIAGYIERARAYNGVCTALVTSDGAPIAAAQGPVRAGAPIVYPTQTVAVDTLLPDYASYTGKPIELGHMEASQSDPNVKLQFGMLVAIPGSHQVNALSTLNIRGERSVTCKGAFDAHPSTGPLPAGAPEVCEEFRRQPDALERASELDAKYGSNPDLAAMPMYCAAFSFKDVFDTRDMRSTGGADVSYAMDAAPEDSTIVAELREKGAIIYAKANLSEYNGGGGNPGGAEAKTRMQGAGDRSTWGGMACNAYDQTYETGGSSAGSAASVGANLATCSICEETGGSCRQPAWRNGVVGLVTTKGLLPYGGSIGAEPYLDRAGIHCRTVRETAMVLDAVKDPQRGYFDPRDIYSALPRALLPKQPYASFTVGADALASKPLTGVRLGIVREYMVQHAVNDAVVSVAIDAEIKRVLRDELGATLVESYDPKYPDDPDVPNMEYGFQAAIAEIVPIHLPELLQQKTGEKLKYDVAGFDVTKRDYMVKLAQGQAPLPDALNLRSINDSPGTASFGYHMAQYLMRRGDARVIDWPTLNANSKYSTEGRAVAMQNWQDKVDLVSAGITQRMKMRDAMRLAVLNVMHRNGIDAFVNPTITVPPARIGYASEPSVNSRPGGRFPTSANLGIPELTVPGGYTTVIFEPKFALNEKKDDYDEVTNSTDPTMLTTPLPMGISFWAGPGDEPILFTIASAYEAATHHREAPAALPPVGKTQFLSSR